MAHFCKKPGRLKPVLRKGVTNVRGQEIEDSGKLCSFFNYVKSWGEEERIEVVPGV